MSAQTPHLNLALMMESVVPATANTSLDKNSNKKLWNITIFSKVFLSTQSMINNKKTTFFW